MIPAGYPQEMPNELRRAVGADARERRVLDRAGVAGGRVLLRVPGRVGELLLGVGLGLASGAVAFVCEEGCMTSESLEVAALGDRRLPVARPVG